MDPLDHLRQAVRDTRARRIDNPCSMLAAGITLVLLIPFLRKLITNKAETPLVDAATACRAVV